ncbi:MAG: SIS domain-containing protein [Pseudomonadota bacterium]
MTSRMAQEIAEIPAACARLGSGPTAKSITAAAEALRTTAPTVLITIGRGSSDHAATYLSYAFGIAAGLIPASYPLSLASLYGQSPRSQGHAALAISQSGQSPDIIAAATAIQEGGAALLVLTNTPDSPLAEVGGLTIDIAAGPERAVAATKTFIVSIVAGLRVLALWQEDRHLLRGLDQIPDALSDALTLPSADLTNLFADTDRLMVLGRGPSLGIAQETALKAMELCQMTAVAFSSAEVKHGPMQILNGAYPVLDLQRADPLPGTRSVYPPGRPKLHPLIDPLLDLVPIYVALEAAARARGLDPDAPARLAKETITL